jgi:acetyl-CoA carboxylase biotin carboxylase subunit
MHSLEGGILKLAIAMTIKKLLIANRGEIAVRIVRACRELSIHAVAVYSEADRSAMHVRAADSAVAIGSSAPQESYLNIQRIVAAALDSGSDAVHPGYGFLAENAEFARAVRAAGLIFIGPSATAIEMMGDKARARRLMIEAGVPVVPGYQDEPDDEALRLAAGTIGFPLLVKAAAGGGGTGMRVVTREDDLGDALAAARREASHAFGNDDLILEKYIRGARHIEFQVLADEHGQILHLNERECSVQRRHQKVIEEAPSPYLTPELRAEMGQAAVAAAQAVSYSNAGTIEFILEPKSGQYYFLEMNTRLQVEHPVTELTTGLDLVQLQIRLAEGTSLAELLPEPPAAPFGHALECRLYAEDPSSGFLPSTGDVLRFNAPPGPGRRLDSGIETGDRVSTHYDPMLAKLIVHAANRPLAIQRMQSWLQQLVLLGLDHNNGLLLSLLSHRTFLQGQVTTDFVEGNLSELTQAERLPIPVLAAAGLSAHLPQATASPHSQSSAAPDSPWDTLTGFRLSEQRERD